MGPHMGPHGEPMGSRGLHGAPNFEFSLSARGGAHPLFSRAHIAQTLKTIDAKNKSKMGARVPHCEGFMLEAFEGLGAF